MLTQNFQVRYLDINPKTGQGKPGKGSRGETGRDKPTRLETGRGETDRTEPGWGESRKTQGPLLLLSVGWIFTKDYMVMSL